MNKVFLVKLTFSVFSMILQFDACAQTAKSDSVFHELPGLDSIRNSERIIQLRMGKYFIGKRKLGTSEVFDRLGASDSTSFKRFGQGMKIQKTGGVVTLVAGITSAILAGALLGSLINEITSTRIGENAKMRNLAIATVVAEGITLVGVATIVSGKIRKNNAVKSYNNALALKENKLSFYIRPSFNRISLGFIF